MKEHELKKALGKIQLSNDGQKRIMEKLKNKRRDEYKMKSKKLIPIAIAATLVLGITAFAAVRGWSEGFLQKMNITEGQMKQLQGSDTSAVAMPNVSDTHDGITVSTAQCLYDGNFVRMAFYVEGYDIENTMEPELEHINILVDGQEGHNYDWCFFNGIDWTDRDNPVMADGSPVKEDEDGEYIPNYRIADGKMEINLNWAPYVESGKRLSGKELENKKITVLFQNFGGKKGIWKLEWTMKNSQEGTLFAPNEELGDTGITINEVTLYAASATVKYAYPKREVEIDAYDEAGNVRKTTDFEEPPELIGVKLKDGTLLTNINDGGSGGYENGNTDEFVARVNFSKILNTDEVDSLLFIKNYPENGKIKITEEDCYVVKLY